MTDPQFPEPPEEGIYLDRDENQEPALGYATQSMIDRNVQQKSGEDNIHSSAQFFEQSASYPTSSDEQMRDYCFVEHSGLQKNAVVETGDEGPIEEENSPGFEPPHPENGHNSEESCGSFLLIKSGAAVDQEVVQNLQTRNNGATGSTELVSEPPAYSELQCGLVVESTETNSNSHLTQPVESHSPSEFSYHSETRFEQGLQQPFISVKSADLEFDSPLQADETALQDTSMDTTVGVSELLSDQTCPEPQTQTLTCYEDLTGSVGIEQGYQTSFDGGSSYHDDVPLEEVDDFQCREALNNDAGQEEIQVPHVQEQPVCITENLTHPPKGVPDTELYGVVEETPRPSFQEICADLDRKNVVSHLHQCTSGQFVMHHHQQPGSLRQQDIVVLNSQTGEVLGSRTQPVQKISLMSGGQSPKVDIMHTSSGDGVNGTTTQQPTNAPDTPAAQGTQPYNYRMQQDGGGGGASPRGGGAGGSGGSNGHMMPYGSMERGRQVYSMAECQMAQLIVFMDRAQVCRRIRPRFNASEITEVLFEHLSPAIDKDSIR
ncbi:hypothetical protein T265_07561 [Opisthorchis viverrini]|uniref:Uncharacterized protein n=1 Tax=Opisthorchis viverrini TaxID=6198 RepID=A0A075AB86_OPIVI|nr:hypothetical protein T265_07561 [Opisthorchis viverrini]KER24889.1 hypothetical protein T265_07561 [Opisthorchis viverrini]